MVKQNLFLGNATNSIVWVIDGSTHAGLFCGPGPGEGASLIVSGSFKNAAALTPLQRAGFIDLYQNI